MSKRIVLGGLLAVGLSLALSSSAQAQYRGGGHYHGGGYGGRVYSVPVYRPVYSGINSPYFGFGSTNGYFPAPIYTTPLFGFNRGYGYNGPGILNIGYSRPGFSLNIGTILRR